jgi:hypothetical protein
MREMCLAVRRSEFWRRAVRRMALEKSRMGSPHRRLLHSSRQNGSCGWQAPGAVHDLIATSALLHDSVRAAVASTRSEVGDARLE